MSPITMVPAPLASHALRVIFVGALYHDTLIHAAVFPAANTKTRATEIEARAGGNAATSARVIAQYPGVKCTFVSSMPAIEACGWSLDLMASENVDMSQCVHRRDISRLPSSFILCCEATGSRTILYQNPLPELSREEMVAAVMQNLQLAGEDNQWVHFEGRNMDATTHTIRLLSQWREGCRETPDLTSGLSRLCRSVRLSIELEKPDRRDALLQAARYADVVFYSHDWAQTHSHVAGDIPAFLRAQREWACSGAVLFCTAGADGAFAYDVASDTVHYARPPPISQLRDSVGAGDTFIGAAIRALSMHPKAASVKEVVDYACMVASRKCELGHVIGLIATAGEP